MMEDVKNDTEYDAPYVGRVLEMVKSYDPILFRETEDFDFDNPPCDPERLSLDMIATMRQQQGYGLSAPQVGLPYRMFVMDGLPTYAVFNPRIVYMSVEQSPPLEEACLSFPGIIMRIRRPISIRVRFQTPNGVTTTKTFMGMTSRCFIHESLHLDGKPFFRGVGRTKMESALRNAHLRGFDYSRLNLMKHAISD